MRDTFAPTMPEVPLRRASPQRALALLAARRPESYELGDAPRWVAETLGGSVTDEPESLPHRGGSTPSAPRARRTNAGPGIRSACVGLLIAAEVSSAGCRGQADTERDAALHPDAARADAARADASGDGGTTDASSDGAADVDVSDVPDVGSSDATSSSTSATGCFPTTARWPLADASQASLQDSYAYRTNTDIHTGVDLPTPVGSNALAILPGRVVEVRQQLDCGHDQVRVTLEHVGDGCTFYSVYNHLDTASVTLDQDVAAGAALGSTNYHCDTAFPHLHFELREGCRLSSCAVHPLRVLPYAYDSALQSAVVLTTLDAAGRAFTTQVSVPREQPDFVRVECDVARADLVTSAPHYDLEQANAGVSFPDVLVDVDPYGTTSAAHVVRYTFSNLDLVPGDTVTCRARNIQGEASSAATATVP